MSMKASRFRLNTLRIIHETVEKETLIIDNETGAYYFIGGVGSEIWQMLTHYHEIDDLVEQVIQRYDGSPATIRDQVYRFLNDLHDEALLVPVGENNLLPSNEIPPLPKTESTIKPTFERPVLKKFTDMQDLLLIDPIHEVSNAGWPFTGKSSDE